MWRFTPHGRTLQALVLMLLPRCLCEVTEAMKGKHELTENSASREEGGLPPTQAVYVESGESHDGKQYGCL